MMLASMEVTSDAILKPHAPSPPSSPQHPLFNTRVQLTIFDRAAPYHRVPILYAFRSPMPDNHALKEGLSRVLFHFPHLAGRFSSDEHCRPCVLLNDAGIRLIETRLPTSLEEHLPLDPFFGDLGRFHPAVEGGEELLQVQLNRFACGGLVIGLTAHHQVADGHSMSSFYCAWARVVQGLNLDPLPYHDRAAISIPRNPPICEFDHRAVEFREIDLPKAEGGIAHGADHQASSIRNLAVHFSPEFMSKLKAKFDIGDPSRRYNTFQCLLTHLWKTITMARGLHEEEVVTVVRVAVNGRPRMRPRVPMEYFGNLVLCAYPNLTVGDLLSKSYAYVADAIHQAVSAIDDAYFRSFIDFGKLVEGEEREKPLATLAPEAGSLLSPHLAVDSWLAFRFHDLDFGGGVPSAFLLPALTLEGQLIFVPSCEKKGGVDVLMSLLDEHVEVFRQISHRLQ